MSNLIRDENNEAIKGDHEIDLERLRLTQDFCSELPLKKALTVVPVRKPNRQEFFRVHPNTEWRLETRVLENKNESETYVVDSSLWSALGEELVPKVIYPCINRHGDVFRYGANRVHVGGRVWLAHPSHES